MSTITIPPVDVTARRYTPEELLALPDDGVSYELDEHGRLVERGMGTESSWIGGQAYARLHEHCRLSRLGWAFPADTSYQCWPDAPNRVRKPDASFVRFGRLPDERLPTGHCRIHPDFVVEVISPNDLAAEIEERLRDYLQAGTALVWIIDPNTRAVRTHRADGSAALAGTGHELSGEQVVPGFKCRVDDLFPPQPQTQPPPPPAAP